MEKQIVLASASPRRVALLEQLGIDFTQRVSDVKETEEQGTDPHRLVEALALAKAQRVVRSGKNELVIGADTIVVLEGEILGKPRDRREAKEMLKRLSGKKHLVISGVAIVDAENGSSAVESETTGVTFGSLTDEEIECYVSTGEPMDKAGAYGIQGVGALFIDGINGCYYNVVGLPLKRLREMLRGFGLDIWKAREREEIGHDEQTGVSPDGEGNAPRR